MACIESDRRQPPSVVGLPSVRPSVTIVVVLGLGEYTVLIALDPVDAAVPFGRDVHANDRSVGAAERPGVFLAVAGA